MSKTFSWGRLLLIGALLTAAPAVRAQEPEPLTADEEFAQLAEKIPGFGGLYVDARGTTHVYLQDLSRAREVEDLGQTVEVHQGDYDFRDLFAWKDEVRQELAVPGAVFLDIDEQRNRLVFGVERDALGAFTQELRSFLRGTRVPPEAVLVEAAEPFLPSEALTDRIRPVPMGVHIQSAGGICTLGVNAVRSGVKGFVTNSHCTVTRSAVEGTVFFQNQSVANDRIGVETVDPPFFVFGGCPPGRVCRRTDAAFVAYDSSALSARGKIANPFSCGVNPGTLTVDPIQPRLPVAGVTIANWLPFIPISKVGRTTGCTVGWLMSTCIDANVQPFITLLCQNRVGGAAGFQQGGDSGAPVFLEKDGEARLLGILWGGPADGTSYVYSPWASIKSELGGSLTPEAP